MKLSAAEQRIDICGEKLLFGSSIKNLLFLIHVELIPLVNKNKKIRFCSITHNSNQTHAKRIL